MSCKLYDRLLFVIFIGVDLRFGRTQNSSISFVYTQIDSGRRREVQGSQRLSCFGTWGTVPTILTIVITCNWTFIPRLLKGFCPKIRVCGAVRVGVSGPPLGSKLKHPRLWFGRIRPSDRGETLGRFFRRVWAGFGLL